MALELDVHNIEKGLFDLFRFAFTSNCNLDDESITIEESKTLEELDPSEVLENFKECGVKPNKIQARVQDYR